MKLEKKVVISFISYIIKKKESKNEAMSVLFFLTPKKTKKK